MAAGRNERRTAILLSVMGIAVAILFALINLERGLPRVSRIEVGAAVIYVLNLVYVARGRHLFAASVVGISVTVLLLLVVARVAGMHAFFWIYSLPLLTFFLLGLKAGLVSNVILILVYSIFLTVGEPKFASLHYLSLDIMLSYLLVVVFAFLYESEQQKHHEELERQSSIDPLTGAHNRRRLRDVLSEEVEREQRYGGGLSIIMFDVDHYKEINDRFGHNLGDSVLAELSRLVRDHIRRSDTFIRFGGDEFLVLAPGTRLPEVSRLADKLRALIESHLFDCPQRITISVGLAQWAPNETVEAFLTRVDNALYIAKAKGRNRVERAAFFEALEEAASA